MNGPGKRPLVRRYEVWLASLDPVVGSEIAKTRPVVIVSPNDYNQIFNTILAAPLTSAQKHYPSRVQTQFQGKAGEIALDQMRTLDKLRLIKLLGEIDPETAFSVKQTLLAYFA